MGRGFHFDCRAGLCDEIVGSVDFAGGREAGENVADKVFCEHADIGVLIGQVTKRPAVEAEDVQQFAKCGDPFHLLCGNNLDNL